MKKNLLSFLIFFLTFSSFACVCASQNITEKYIESDFVANITIIKIYPNDKNSYRYKADIKINELFKGVKLKSIYVNGRSDGGMGTSCDIFIPVNTKLIAYAHKNQEGFYEVGMCSGLFYLNKKGVKPNPELDILKTFKLERINFTDKTKYREISNSSLELEKYKGIQLKKSYGIYEITFASNLEIKEVKEISGFDNPIDEELVAILKNTKWSSNSQLQVKNQVVDNTKFVIGFYYYKAEKGNKSFISSFYLY
ncbi:hypothetical protein [Flavobacterium sp. Root420]|uniref:hypothetical protein n=1 Tax=Flavobacterium sp. Root420 TaxID=1736533 RepID=UPI0006FF4B73|nr:hypothetical protein [Flavobacterium sp. Root420]KQW99305.1 hypothetical protein ASC72_09475 [Flavobacterium sp. Root420]